MGRASGGSNTPHWIRNNILDFLRAMSMNIAVENGKICNTMCYFLCYQQKSKNQKHFGFSCWGIEIEV